MLLLSKFFRERSTCRNSRRKAISGNTSDGSFFTTSVETIFSFRSWEIKAMVSQMIEWGLIEKQWQPSQLVAYERWPLTRGGRSLWVLLLMIWLGNFKYSEKVVSNERWSQREVRLYLFAYFFYLFHFAKLCLHNLCFTPRTLRDRRFTPKMHNKCWLIVFWYMF